MANVCRQLSFTLGLLLICSTVTAETISVLSTPADFHMTGRNALRGKLPVLVLFSSTDCGYCEFVKENILTPMLNSGDYNDKALIRVVDIDSGDDVRDFNGRLIDSEELADRYDVQLTPTVTFLDAKGKQLVEPVIGLGTVEYYGSFLDEAIAQSLKKLRQ